MRVLILLLASIGVTLAWPPAVWTHGPKNLTKKEKNVPKPILHPIMDFHRIDECAFKCLTDAVDSSTPCKVTDLKCACDNAEPMAKTAKPCIVDNCGIMKALKVASTLKKMCKEVGVDFDQMQKNAETKAKMSDKVSKKKAKQRKKMLKKAEKAEKKHREALKRLKHTGNKTE